MSFLTNKYQIKHVTTAGITVSNPVGSNISVATLNPFIDALGNDTFPPSKLGCTHRNKVLKNPAITAPKTETRQRIIL